MTPDTFRKKLEKRGVQVGEKIAAEDDYNPSVILPGAPPSKVIKFEKKNFTKKDQ